MTHVICYYRDFFYNLRAMDLRRGENYTLCSATFDEFLSRAKIISFRLLPYFYSEEKQLYWPRLLPCKNKGNPYLVPLVVHEAHFYTFFCRDLQNSFLWITIYYTLGQVQKFDFDKKLIWHFYLKKKKKKIRSLKQ